MAGIIKRNKHKKDLLIAIRNSEHTSVTSQSRKTHIHAMAKQYSWPSFMVLQKLNFSGLDDEKHSLRPRHCVKINGVNTSVANEKRLSGCTGLQIQTHKSADTSRM